MWNTLTLQRPKAKEKPATKTNPGQEKHKLRRAKTFCDTIKDNSSSEAKPNNKTWLKNIRNWRKKFTKNDLNYRDGFQELSRDSSSASRDSLDRIR